MQAVSILTHLLRALRRAFGRVVLWFVASLLVTAAVVEGVAYFAAGRHLPPTVLTNVAAVALAVVIAYAAALTVLIGEIVRFMVSTVQEGEHDLARDLTGGKQVVDALLHTIEQNDHPR